MRLFFQQNILCLPHFNEFKMEFTFACLSGINSYRTPWTLTDVYLCNILNVLQLSSPHNSVFPINKEALLIIDLWKEDFLNILSCHMTTDMSYSWRTNFLFFAFLYVWWKYKSCRSVVMWHYVPILVDLN